jgi:hypothetical protein
MTPKIAALLNEIDTRCSSCKGNCVECELTQRIRESTKEEITPCQLTKK